MTVETDMKGKGEIQLYAAGTGQAVVKQDVKNLEIPSRIDVGKLPAGLYILKVNGKTGTKAIKVMKE
jgi:hypothetical protein